MRTIKVHSTNSIRFTQNAQIWCDILNTYKRLHPNRSFKQMAERFNLSETNARRYFYGCHHFNNQPQKGYTQMRQGAKVTL